MENWQAYCDTKEQQLSVLEGQVGILTERMPQATSETKARVEQLVARWKEDSVGVRRRLTEIRQAENGERESLRAGADQALVELTAVVESATAAF